MDGAKVTIPMAVVEGNEAPTPLQQRAMDQRSEDSSRGGKLWFLYVLWLLLLLLPPKRAILLLE